MNKNIYRSLGTKPESMSQPISSPPSQEPQVFIPTPRPPRKINPLTIALLVALLAFGLTSAFLYYRLGQVNDQLDRTTSLLQHRIDLSDHFSDNCLGNWNSNFTVEVVTCTDSFGDICTTILTINGTSDTSTTTCRPA